MCITCHFERKTVEAKPVWVIRIKVVAAFNWKLATSRQLRKLSRRTSRFSTLSKKEQPQAKESVAEMPQGRCQHTKMQLTMTSLYHAIKNISPYRVKLLVDLRLKYSPNQQKKLMTRNYLLSSTNDVTENLSTQRGHVLTRQWLPNGLFKQIWRSSFNQKCVTDFLYL